MKLKDFQTENRRSRNITLLVPMQLGEDEASKRLVIHTVRRVIQKHKDELIALANKQTRRNQFRLRKNIVIGIGSGYGKNLIMMGLQLMDFFEKHTRTLGFLISIFVNIALFYILIIGYEKFNSSQLGLLIFLIVLISLCTIGQVIFRDSTGYIYTLLTVPSLLLAIYFGFF